MGHSTDEFLDAFGSIYRVDEISNLSDELMAELGRDERTLEKLGAQDLTLNEVSSTDNISWRLYVSGRHERLSIKYLDQLKTSGGKICLAN